MQDIHFSIFINIVKEWEEKLNEISDKEEYKKYLDWFKWKVIHSARVTNICKEIAIKEEFENIIPSMEKYMTYNKNNGTYQLNSSGVYIASLCGLYHDIGRFPQIVKYHTEIDYMCPIDHGTHGYQMLKDNKLFNDNLSDEIKIILEAVRQHNQYKLDESNDFVVNYFCSLLRDADKIDIINGLVEGKVPLLDQKNTPISDGVINDINKEQMVLNNHSINLNDRLAVMFSYYFDINTNTAKNYIKEEKIFEKLYDKIEHKEDFKIILNSKILKRGLNNVR